MIYRNYKQGSTFDYSRIVSFFSDRLFDPVKLNDFKEFLNQYIAGGQELDINRDPYILLSDGDTVWLNFSDRYIYLLKMALDARTLRALGKYTQLELDAICQDIRSKLRGNLVSVIVIGSVARARISKTSDIDLYVIVSNRIKTAPKISSLHKLEIYWTTVDKHQEAFKDRDELCISALKYGLIVYDTDFISSFLVPRELQVGTKSIMRKRKVINKLIKELSDSREIPDDRLYLKLRRLVYHFARYIILINGKIPLSKAELGEQFSQHSRNLHEKITEFENMERERSKMIQFFYEFRGSIDELMAHSIRDEQQ